MTADHRDSRQGSTRGRPRAACIGVGMKRCTNTQQLDEQPAGARTITPPLLRCGWSRRRATLSMTTICVPVEVILHIQRASSWPPRSFDFASKKLKKLLGSRAFYEVIAELFGALFHALEESIAMLLEVVIRSRAHVRSLVLECKVDHSCQLVGSGFDGFSGPVGHVCPGSRHPERTWNDPTSVLRSESGRQTVGRRAVFFASSLFQWVDCRSSLPAISGRPEVAGCRDTSS